MDEQIAELTALTAALAERVNELFRRMDDAERTHENIARTISELGGHIDNVAQTTEEQWRLTTAQLVDMRSEVEPEAEAEPEPETEQVIVMTEPEPEPEPEPKRKRSFIW